MSEKKFRILQVDDDEANRYAVKLILERAGYEVFHAENGREGIAMAENLPDLIILDIRLPDVDGYEVCRVIKSRLHLSSIPVLQTSATFISSEAKVEGLDSGADGYLSQPIDSAVLLATVRSLLRIRTAEKEALEARRAQEETMAIVSHDLRNPLSVIMLQAKILSKEIEKNDSVSGNILPKLEKITHSCNRMNKLIEDLLTVTNIEQGNLKLQKAPISVSGLVHDVYLSFEDLAAQKQVRLKKKIDHRNESVIVADRDRIFQVLANIVSNALRFTSPEGTIEIGVEETPAAYLFHIQDTGSGIPALNLPHIFDRYWQGHKDRGTGVGLGLSIVKGIVEAHDGTVWAESELGKGTKFQFILPR